MRYHEIVSEDTEADTEKLALATKVAHDLMRYAHTRGKPDVEVQFRDGTVYAGFMPDQFDQTGTLGDDLIVLVGKRNSTAAHGSFAKLRNPIAEKNHAIFINVARSNDIENIMVFLTSTDFMQVFRHEMIHVLDERATRKVFTVAKYGKESEGDNVRPSEQEYYNNPWEFNAFYHMIADSILSVLKEYKKTGDLETVRDYADLYDMTGEFWHDMERCLHSERHSKAFLKNLTQPRRRAFLRRLYQAHATFKGLLIQARAQATD